RHPLGKRLLTSADRENDLVGSRELFGDLETGVSTPDHEHRPLWHIVGTSVARAVRLPNAGVELVRQLGDVRRLKWPGRDHDLVGGDRPTVHVEDKTPTLVGKPAHVALELDWQLEGLRVALEVADYLVASRVVVRIAGEGKPRQPAVPPRREELQRVPALAPRRRD